MFFRKIFINRHSKNVAKDRLKVLLISDRIDCSPELLNVLKEEISKVVSKYIEIDSDSFSVQIRNTTSMGENSCQANLCAQVNIKSVSNSKLIKLQESK